MSKNEKRYFKIYSSAFSKEDADYLRLFDAITEKNNYDEAALKKELEIKNFPVAKRYLFQAILKSLRTYLTDDSSSFQILDAFKNISILRNRGLVKEAIKVYEKTEPILKAHSLNTFLIELYNSGDILWSLHLPNKELPNKLTEIEKQKAKAAKELDNLITYQILSREIRNLYRDIHPIRSYEQEKEVQKYLEHPLLQNADNALVPLAKGFYYECLALCNVILLDYDQMRENALQAVNEFLSIESPSLPEYKALISNLSNLLLALAKRNRAEEFEEYTEIFNKFQTKLKGKLGLRFDVMTQKLHYNFYFNYWVGQDEFDKIVEREKEISIFWKKYEAYLDLDWKNTVSFIIAQALFFKEQYDEALKWVDITLTEEKNNPKTPCICNARILNVMIYFEKGEYQFLSSLILSTYRFLNKKDRLFNSEKLMLKFFKWVSKNSIGDLNSKKSQLFEELEEEWLNNRYEKNFIEEMKLQLWYSQSNQ